MSNLCEKIEIETDVIIVQKLGYSISIRGAGNLKINNSAIQFLKINNRIIQSEQKDLNLETLMSSNKNENIRYKITIEMLEKTFFKDDIISNLLNKFESFEKFLDLIVEYKNDVYFQDKDNFNIFCDKMIDELHKDMKF